MNQIINLLSLKPAASVCIAISIFLLMYSALSNARVGGLELEVDHSSKRFINLIAISLLTLGFVFMFEPSFASVFSVFQEDPVDKLHRAAVNWDEGTALEAIQQLETSGNRCDQEMASQMKEIMEVMDVPGLNYVNQIQQNVELLYPECSYPILIHSDQL
ncbi:hypothetical protein PN498_16750 [Oscillatoria sp. CS-180]|uniref:hypothetical protein n=1 Tax=Oscillatoria sp. CS-180 TaxID=3021720 RepID=UPI00232D9711|nr:hypothetical protein [Oscillatoria sp. CS-180]MDB9527648.1 hypothetical protein [Oscillatoria sp. CS-180]